MDFYEPLKLYRLLRQWNGFEDINILSFSKILFKFAKLFKIFDYFLPFLSLTIITANETF